MWGGFLLEIAPYFMHNLFLKISSFGASQPPPPCRLNIQNLTVIYSHGNAEDIGLDCDFFQFLAAGLRVNIVGYDYTGYGPRTNGAKPSERATYKNIEAVYNWVTKVKGVPEENVVL